MRIPLMLLLLLVTSLSWSAKPKKTTIQKKPQTAKKTAKKTTQKTNVQKMREIEDAAWSSPPFPSGSYSGRGKGTSRSRGNPTFGSSEGYVSEDIEFKCTYVRQGELEYPKSFVVSGNITNTGNQVARTVRVWCFLTGFMIEPDNAKKDEYGYVASGQSKINDSAYIRELGDSFRNLRPGETRPVNFVVNVDRRQVVGIPRGWNAVAGPVLLTYEVRVE